jgi:hypothetical protein
MHQLEVVHGPVVTLGLGLLLPNTLSTAMRTFSYTVSHGNSE